ncbi:MAG: prepilin-type N-terminal cleavage/methylation domain-containing protein [Acidobacteriota bacterium]
MSSRRPGPYSEQGFTVIEVLVAMAILASVCLFMSAYLHTIIKRERTKATVREVSTMVLSARMQALRRECNVVLQIDPVAHDITSWADSLPLNLVRDRGEMVLSYLRLPASVSLRSVAGVVDGPDSVSFDEYQNDATLVDRIVFRSDGSLLVPQAPNSRVPDRPVTYSANVPSMSVNCRVTGCRGIFIADRSDGGTSRNLFRIGVDDFGRTGKPSLLKWLPPEQGGNGGERNFVPPPWKWTN